MDYTKDKDTTQQQRLYQVCGGKIKIRCKQCEGTVTIYIEDPIEPCKIHNTIPTMVTDNNSALFEV